MVKITKYIIILYLLLSLGGYGYAEPVDLDVVVVDVTDIELLVASLLGACAVMWGIRKMIKMMNRS